ncbi:MAG: hypothetical protein QM710_15560 [Flavobacterium sp.]
MGTNTQFDENFRMMWLSMNAASCRLKFFLLTGAVFSDMEYAMNQRKRKQVQGFFTRLCSALLICATLLPTSLAWAQEQKFTPAKLENDEGGPVSVAGKVTYTNAFFTLGVAEPMVILEDEAGFVDRNKGFILPKASQVLGQITSDFFTSPFSYTISLPIEPQATLRDVDQNGTKDKGVMVYAVAYWTNTFGDPFLEERDLGGGGWSTAYASTRVSELGDNKDEIVGGKLLVYAPDDQQGFPSDFGDDGKLFTKDDPIVGLPQGYTIVDMDTHPFTFDRTRHPEIDLIEPADTALADFSKLSYSSAFDAMIDKMSKEYAFTDYKHIDRAAKAKEFRPRFVKAEQDKDAKEYLRARCVILPGRSLMAMSAALIWRMTSNSPRAAGSVWRFVIWMMGARLSTM